MDDPVTDVLPDLTGWEATRDTLHLYSRVAGAVRRALVPAHSRWWHVSLRVYPRGLTTTAMPTVMAGRAGSLELRLNLAEHCLELVPASPGWGRVPLDAGLSASRLGERVMEALAALGIEAAQARQGSSEDGSSPGGGGRIDRQHFADEDPRPYEQQHAAAYLRALRLVEAHFATAAREMRPETGPIQLWPHHFDLAYEWFGERETSYQEDGEERTGRAQIGFGFSPGDENVPEPYFYANPWPFDEGLTRHPLPGDAVWNTRGWQGALLTYGQVRQAGLGLLPELHATVYEAAAPGLR